MTAKQKKISLQTWFAMVGVIVLIAMNNCTPTPGGLDLSQDSLEKSNALEKMQVFDEITNPTHGTDGTVAEVPETGNTIEMSVSYMCSQWNTGQKQTNVTQSTRLELRLLRADGSIACANQTGVRENIVNLKKISISTCAGLTDGSYKIMLVDPDKVALATLDGGQLLLGGSGAHHNDTNLVHYDAKLKVVKAGDDFYFTDEAGTRITPNPWVLYDTNTATSGGVGAGGPDLCEIRASPLVVDTHASTDKAEGIRLTSPIDGILFNILGWAQTPANTKKRISWINNFNRYKFLVMPTSDGKVNGIDQMFGDNTRGPDGAFAENGFKALAKFDGKDFLGHRQIRNADGKISADDDIYAKLALWSDRNMNGTVEAGELQSLRDAGLSEIDLAYDPNFSETDKYGNRTELKSVVKFEDGRTRLIFDLWFRYVAH